MNIILLGGWRFRENSKCIILYAWIMKQFCLFWGILILQKFWLPYTGCSSWLFFTNLVGSVVIRMAINNSSPASAYSAPSHYLNRCWVIVNWTRRNKLQWNFNQNTKFFTQENASENIICNIVVILSRGRGVNYPIISRVFSRICK